jgi:hypothetical protein
MGAANKDQNRASLSTDVQALQRIIHSQENSEKRVARFAAVVAATTGAIAGSGAWAVGLAPALIVLISVIPGTLTGYICARSSNQRRRKHLPQELKLIERSGTTDLRPSPRVLAILRGILSSSTAQATTTARAGAKQLPSAG